MNLPETELSVWIITDNYGTGGFGQVQRRRTSLKLSYRCGSSQTTMVQKGLGRFREDEPP